MKTLLFLIFSLTLNAQISGKVIEKESYRFNGNIYTNNYVETSTDTIVIKTLGGIIGLTAETVSDTPQLFIGQSGLFYTENNYLERFTSSENSTVNSTISPTVASAGTFETITITGTGFGENQGKVGFRNANIGGAAFTFILDSQIISWTDTEVIAQVPSFAGSGNVRVKTLEGINIDSSNNLEVPFAVINFNYQKDAYFPQQINDNGLGGYTWQYSTSMDDLSRSLFNNAIDTWRCQTNINWTFGEDVDTQAIANDGINIITYSQSGTLGTGTLGQCTTRYQACFIDNQIFWYISEQDIVINRDILWNYTNDNAAGFHFESVAVHELGHAQTLGHVTDQNKIMYFAFNANDFNISLEETALDGASYVLNNSLNDICDNEGISFYQCQSLSTPDTELTTLKIYPNPTTGKINIRGDLYTLTGKRIRKNTNDLSGLSVGLYFLVTEFKTYKMIKK